MPTHARVQVAQDGGRHVGRLRAGPSDPRAPVRVWTRTVECLVAELATGQGARPRETGDHMVATAYRVRQLTTLELLMHQKLDHHLGRKSLFCHDPGLLVPPFGEHQPAPRVPGNVKNAKAVKTAARVGKT